MRLQNSTIKDLQEELTKGYPEAKDFYFNFTKTFEDNELLELKVSRLLDEHDDFELFIYCTDLLALYSIYRGIYLISVQEDEINSALEFTRACDYGYMTIHITSLLCFADYDYSWEGKPKIEMDRVSALWGASFLVNDLNKADEIGIDLINSLNAEGCIVGRGMKDAHLAWFMVKLFSLATEKKIDERKPIYPEKDSDYKFYERVLADWDNLNINTVDKLISILCEQHLITVSPMLSDYDAYPKPFLRLLPFEVIMLLKLRKRNGLKNPKKFTHELMNTPVMQLFLNEKNIYPESVELPFAKELLVKLESKYPNMRNIE